MWRRGRATAWVLALVLGCHGEKWTGKSPLARDLDGVNIQYREYESTHGEPGQRLAYVLNAQNPTDVAHISALGELGEWAHDDGKPPDRTAGDGEFSGEFLLAEHRRDPRWFFKARHARVGEAHNPLPADQEAAHPYANRRVMAGGAGGAYDNASVCPPGYVMTGLRYRVDAASSTLAHVAPTCRALPRDDGKTPRHMVEGGWWGEDNRAPIQTTECPPGSAVLSSGSLSLGTWHQFTVVAGIRLACARMDDGSRREVQTLTVGYPSTTLLPFRCLETDTVQPLPLASGLRVIAGQRLDALGLLCDVGPDDNAQAATILRFTLMPSHALDLAFPVRSSDGAPLFARAQVEGRRAALDGTVLQLPVADASVAWRALSPDPVPVVAPLPGCVVSASAHELLLSSGGAECGTQDATVLAWLRNADFTALAGTHVEAGAVVGALPPGTTLHLRLVSGDLVRRHADPAAPGPPVTPLSDVKGPGSTFLLRLP